MARYGERGRQFTYQDNFWHLSTLDTALRMGGSATWLEYVEWLRAFINSRGMNDAVTCANWVFFKRLLLALEVPAAQQADRDAVVRYLDEAIALFPEEARTPPGT
jgi:hypothetical protein